MRDAGAPVDPADPEVGQSFEGVIDRWATGGAGVARASGGRVVLADDAAVGDRARIEITARHKRHAEGRVIEVLEPGPGRRGASCPHARVDADPRCGGCDWQHIEPAAASAARRSIVADSFARLGRFDADGLDLRAGPDLPAVGYRTILRAGVLDGRAGFRRPRSHELAVPETCEIAHPLAAELLIDGRFGDATSVAIKVGARTGERMVVLDGPVGPDLRGVVVPDDATVVTRTELDAGRVAFVHEEIAGPQGSTRFRISADSFFQCRPDGADALVAAVAAALGEDGSAQGWSAQQGSEQRGSEQRGGTLVDLYAGVGLFAGTVAAGFDDVVAVEANPSSTADARVNLPKATVITSTVERWRSSAARSVVADPSRKGLGRGGVAKLLETGAANVALVSCDPAAAARDARWLCDAGYRLGAVTVFDLFGSTSHIEVVSAFRRDR